MEIESIKPFLVVVVSLLGAILIVMTRKNPNLREGVSLGTGVLKFLLVLTMIPTVLAGNTLHYTIWSFYPTVPIALRVDGLGLVFALTASFLWILTTLYSMGYMRSLNEHAQTRYYTCFAVTLSATMGAAFSDNWFTLFLFYELITFFTYPLVAHSETKEAFAGGNKYLLYLMATSKAFLAAGIIWLYYIAGTLDFVPGGILPADVDPKTLLPIFFLMLFGAGKAAVMPFSSWLPASMVAPTPVSALLHAVAVVNTGAFCVLRIIFDTFGVDVMRTAGLGTMTAYLVSFTIIMASVYALTRDNIKERIAYSTVSQISYIILGGALLTPFGMAGGIMHIANHAFSKITLFFCAGAIYVAAKKTKVSELNGIGRQMPWTMAAFAIATLSMVGVPPVAGFLSKWYLAIGSMEAHQLPILFVLLVSSLLNAGYFLPIVHKAFFKAPDSGLQYAVAGDKDGGGVPKKTTEIREAPKFMLYPLVATAVISVLLGLFPELLLDLIKQVLG